MLLHTSPIDKEEMMAQVDQGVILNDGKVSEVLKYFNQDGGVDKNREFVAGFKKRKAGGNMAMGIGLAVVCVLATIYGVADVFTDARLPFGVLFLIGGPLGFVFSLVVLAKGIGRFAAASNFSYAGSLDELCRQFYSAAFCRAGTDSESREDYLADASHLIPAVVLENYQGDGWTFFEGREEKKSDSVPIKCSACDKAHGHSERTYISVPLNEDVEGAKEGKKVLYLDCTYCGYKICYNCVDNGHPSELRYLCPQCGKASNGMKGLASRWATCRRKASKEDTNFTISEMTVSEGDRINDKAVNIFVTLKGDPYRVKKFRNVAVNIDGSWFLATPEPLVQLDVS